MAYTTPATAVSLAVLTAGWLNTYVRDNVAWLATDSPAVRVYHSVNLSVGNAAWGTMPYDSERYDNAAMHSTSVNTERLVIPTGAGGKYIVGGGISWALSAAGNARSARIGVNATPTIVAWQVSFPSATVGSEVSMCSTYAMSATDYFIFQLWQDSGGGLNIVSVAQYSPEFWCSWLRT